MCIKEREGGRERECVCECVCVKERGGERVCVYESMCTCAWIYLLSH